jgi:hypothetical protein
MIVFYTEGGEFFSFRMSSPTHPEINFATRAVGELAFVQYLEKDHNDVLHFMRVRMKATVKETNLVSLFNLVE